MKASLHLVIILFSMLVLLNGCKKEGPEGPAGKDGNANVQSSTITFSTWLWDGTNNYDYSDFTWAAITSSIVDKGAVLVYVNTPGGWAPLPRTIYPSATYSESQRFIYNVGTFRIIVQDSDLTQPSPALGSWTIKILTIESKTMVANSNLDWSNYNAVKIRFELTD
ncbi:MAG: hypothetical protein WAV23_03065 [Minisyncoccia bacterium]